MSPPNGKEVVAAVRDKTGLSNLWLASLDLSFAPRQFPSTSNEDEPHWDRAGRIYFRVAEGAQNFVYRMNADGSERAKAISEAIAEIHSVSPDGRWLLASQGSELHTMANSLVGGASLTICQSYCAAFWTGGGGAFNLCWDSMSGIETAFIPVSLHDSMPPIPDGGFHPAVDLPKEAKIVSGFTLLGPLPGQSASVHQDVHRNLYRVPLP
jgi:hypothetical protein